MSSSDLSRRDFLTLSAYAAGAASLGILPSCNRGSNTISKTQTLTTGYIPIVDSAPLLVAYEKGFFKQHGIKADRPTLIRGWPALIEAFTSKQILLTHILLPQVIFMRYARKVPIRSVAFNHTEVIGMLRGKHLSSNKDFGGTVVGCPTWWAPHTGLFQDVIRALGFTPVVDKRASEIAPNEVGFRVIPPPDMIDAIRNEAISGYVISEPFVAGGELLADATLIKLSGDIWPNHPCCQSVLHQETIDRDPEWAKAVTTALYQAALWCHENMEELSLLLSKEGGGYFPMPQKVVKRALLHHDLEEYGPNGTGAIMHTDWNVRRAGFTPWPYESAIQQTLDLMNRMVVSKSVALPESIKKLTGKEVAEDLIAYDLAKAAMDNVGGFASFGVEDATDKVSPFEVVMKSE